MNANQRDGAAVIEPNDLPDPMPPRRVASPPAPPRLGRIVFVAALVVGAVFVAGLVPRMREHKQVLHESKELAIPSVTLVSPQPGKAGVPLALSGELKAVSETPLVARVAGYVKSWNADIGAKVNAGDVLAELDTPEINQDLAKAKADLHQAEAAQALSELTARRWKEMLQAKTVSSQEADEKAADLKLKQATVDGARATVQRLTEWVAFGKITAPFAGTVTARHLDVGQLVNIDVKEELYRLAQTDHLRVYVRIPQSYARSATVGLTVELTVPELPGRKFDAKIVRNAGAFDAASRTLLTELEVDNTKGELFAGSYAQVRLIGAQPDAPLTAPANTLLFRPEGPVVALVTADNKVSIRKVELGRDFGLTVEFLGGVTAADHLVLNPPDSLVDGIEVKPVTPAAAPPAAK